MSQSELIMKTEAVGARELSPFLHPIRRVSPGMRDQKQSERTVLVSQACYWHV